MLSIEDVMGLIATMSEDYKRECFLRPFDEMGSIRLGRLSVSQRWREGVGGTADARLQRTAARVERFGSGRLA